MADLYDDASEAVHALTSATVALDAAQQAFKEARAALFTALKPLAVDPNEPPHDPRLMALLRYLYWNEPDVPVRELAAVCGFSYLGQMLELIGPVPSGIACTRCGRDIPRTSRTWKPHHTGPRVANPGPVCRTCDSAMRKERDQGSRLEWARRAYVDRAGVEAHAWEWRLACEVVRAYPPVSTRVEPGSELDRQTGTWYEFDSSIYVARVVGADREPGASVKVPADAALTLVTAALNAAAWDSARVSEIAAPFGDEAPTYVLSRLHERIGAAREYAEAKVREVYPDGHEFTEDGPREPYPHWHYTVRPPH